MIYIIGAGMSGLLIANILKQYNPVILEGNYCLPTNHHALLRFKSRAIEDVTGIKLQHVKVQKAIYYKDKLYTKSNLQLQNAYSFKVSGGVYPRSNLNIDDCDRYIAPLDFIDKLASNVEIRFGEHVTEDKIVSMWNEGDIIISTIPMPVLMDMMLWKNIPKFGFRPIYTATCIVKDPRCNVNQTIYFCDPDNDMYRASLSGDELIVEFIQRPILCMDTVELLEKILWNNFGIVGASVENVSVHEQQYGKISPINETTRRDFIYAMSANYNLYSFGRFATWRQLLLEDLIRDAQVIERLFTQRNKLFINDVMKANP